MNGDAQSIRGVAHFGYSSLWPKPVALCIPWRIAASPSRARWLPRASCALLLRVAAGAACAPGAVDAALQANLAGVGNVSLGAGLPPLCLARAVLRGPSSGVQLLLLRTRQLGTRPSALGTRPLPHLEAALAVAMATGGAKPASQPSGSTTSTIATTALAATTLASMASTSEAFQSHLEKTQE